MKKYIKKVIVKDEMSTEQARGERVRRIRNLANLSRKEMCNDGTLNINTFKGWEIGRYGGLPLDGAEKIISRVAKEGVKCTAEWLLYGIGTPPQVITNFSQIKELEKQGSFLNELNDEQQEKFIRDELLLFGQHFKDIIYIQIKDDGMLPFYKIGDYVAGVNHYGEKIHKLINLECIIQIDDGSILLRVLREGTQKDLYTLICTNMQTTLKEPVLYNTKVLSAAPVVRHLRKNF